jgi:hypothetical protein
MEQSPSWEANRFSASQEIPDILWKLKFNYRNHQYPPQYSYPELDQSSPCPHVPLPEYLCLYYPTIHATVFRMIPFHLASPPKHCKYLLSPVYATWPYVTYCGRISVALSE